MPKKKNAEKIKEKIKEITGTEVSEIQLMGNIDLMAQIIDDLEDRIEALENKVKTL